MQTTEFIQVDSTGRRLALTRAGSGAPTVVLETGLGPRAQSGSQFSRRSRSVPTCSAMIARIVG